MNVDGRKLAAKRDEWFVSNEFQRSMVLPIHVGNEQYLKNRLELAFLAGAKAAEEIINKSLPQPKRQEKRKRYEQRIQALERASVLKPVLADFHDLRQRFMSQLGSVSTVFNEMLHDLEEFQAVTQTLIGVMGACEWPDQDIVWLLEDAANKHKNNIVLSNYLQEQALAIKVNEGF